MQRAAKLDKPVTFQRQAEDSDGGGGSIISWANITGLVRIKASVVFERGRERLEAGRLEAAVNGVLKIRDFELARTITEKDRVVIDDIPHQIRSITPPSRTIREIEMIIERGVAT